MVVFEPSVAVTFTVTSVSAILPSPIVTFVVLVNSFTGPLSTEYVPFFAFASESVISNVSVVKLVPLALSTVTSGSVVGGTTTSS